MNIGGKKKKNVLFYYEQLEWPLQVPEAHTCLEEVQCIGTAVVKATNNEGALKMVVQFNSEQSPSQSCLIFTLCNT